MVFQGMNSRSSPVPKPVGSTFIVSSRRMDELPSAPGVPRPGYSLSEHLSHISPSYRPPESPYALDQTPAQPVARTAETPQVGLNVEVWHHGLSQYLETGCPNRGFIDFCVSKVWYKVHTTNKINPIYLQILLF